MDLIPLLEELGIQGIRDGGGREITALCPLHEARTGHPDTHPSWSINRDTGLHICFSCGWSGGLNSLYVDLGLSLPTDLDQQMMMADLKVRVGKLVQGSQSSELKLPSTNDKSDFSEEWDELRLRTMDPVPRRMADIRKLDPVALHTYGVLWDRKNSCWVLPIRTEFGTLRGVQLRQKGVESNQPAGIEKSHHLFGLSALSDRRCHHVTLVESPLDAVRLYGLGIPAVSSFGAWVSTRQVQLLTRHFNTVVLALDNDRVGREATARVEKLLSDRKILVLRFDYTGLAAKDPGDVESDEELVAAWNRSQHAGLARMKKAAAALR